MNGKRAKMLRRVTKDLGHPETTTASPKGHTVVNHPLSRRSIYQEVKRKVKQRDRLTVQPS